MKTVKNVLVSFFAVVLFCQCAKDTGDINVNEDISSEYSVYSAILNQGFEKIKKPLVVQQTSDVKKSFSFDENVYDDRIAPEGISKEIFDDLLLKNDSVYELENKFDILPRKVKLVATSDLKAVFEIDGAYSG